MSALIDRIGNLAGDRRSKTFTHAAWFMFNQQNPIIIETGCYRGSDCDGQSTLILALLAKETGGRFISYDLHQHNIDKSKEFLAKNGMDNYAEFVCGNSGETLLKAPSQISLAYLDSYDFEEHKAIDAQAHQLVEVGVLLPKMARTSAFLLDDCDLPLGGKAGLSIAPLVACGYQEVATGYQKLFVRL